MNSNVFFPAGDSARLFGPSNPLPTKPEYPQLEPDPPSPALLAALGLKVARDGREWVLESQLWKSKAEAEAALAALLTAAVEVAPLQKENARLLGICNRLVGETVRQEIRHKLQNLSTTPEQYTRLIERRKQKLGLLPSTPSPQESSNANRDESSQAGS